MSTCRPLLDINIPNYASAIVTTNQIVDLLSAVQALEKAAEAAAIHDRNSRRKFRSITQLPDQFAVYGEA